jgi:hypothetical protein
MFKDKKWYLKEEGAVPDEKYLKKLDAYAAYTGAVKDRENAYKDLYDREEFSYDVNKDAMYDKLVQDYAENASKAAEDAMGRAAAMTGGYGNSYAQQVSQQTFQDYMGGLDAEADKLYDRALDRYLLQGDLLKEKYDLATDRVKETYEDYVATQQDEPVEKVEDDAPDTQPEVIDLDKYDDELSSFVTQEQVESFLLKRVASGEMSREKAMELLDAYATNLPSEKEYYASKRSAEDYEVVSNGGLNLFGMDRNAIVKYSFENGNTEELTLAELFKKLQDEGKSKKQARKIVMDLQKELELSLPNTLS